MNQCISCVYNIFDDGHNPGNTDVETRIADYRNKHSEDFLNIYDNLFPDRWSTQAYEYAIERDRPWGDPFSI